MENLAENIGLQTPMGLAEVIQLCCLGRRTGQITFRSGDSTGQVYLQHGQVLHAAAPGSEGENAIYYMLTWPPGTYTLAEEILPHKRTVGLTWEQLLFEGARLADEGLVGQHLPPPTSQINGDEQIARTGTQGGQPRLTILVPDGPPITHELEAEFTHLGRVATGNDIVLPYPSVSGRHCIFILSGTDVMLRDLNSSNGTTINGQPITESILHLGDTVHVGGIEIRFESAVRRPKLNLDRPSTTQETIKGQFKALSQNSDAIRANTTKLPTKAEPTVKEALRRDTAPIYVNRNQAISYDALAPEPEKPKKNYLFLILSTVFLVLLIFGGLYAYWYLKVEHRVIDIGPVHVGPF